MKRMSILLILLVYGAMPIRAQPKDMHNNDNYCHYDSQCEAGYFCYQNQCTHLLPTMTPIVSEVPIQPIETSITDFTIYEQHLINNANNDDSGAKVNESESVDVEEVREMDECGNVYDLDGNLLWGSGECNLDSTSGSETKVYAVSNPKETMGDKQVPTTAPIITPSLDDLSINSSTQMPEANELSDINNKEQGLKYLVIGVGCLLIIATIGYSAYVTIQSKKKKTF